MIWEVLVWIQGVEGAKMVVGRIKNGKADARDEWLLSLWKEVRDMNRREVEDWVNDKILFMAEWFRSEEVLKGEEVDWSKMSKGVPRYIVEKEDAGCLGVEGEGWIVYDKTWKVKSEKKLMQEQQLIERKEEKRKRMWDVLGWMERGGLCTRR
jgi:hypothetical protein